jgi:serine/threonine protein kinase
MTEEVKIEENIAEDYYIGKVLGKGNFGTALLCRKQSENNAKYVIKKLDFSKIPDNKKSKSFDNISNEIYILDILRPHCGEYIMCYIKTIIQDPFIYIVCEFLENFSPLNDIFDEVSSFVILARLCNNLLVGLEKIHSLNVCHRDIKPQNIMYNIHTFDIKYIDFGFSLAFVGNITKSGVAVSTGTPNYLYPPFYPGNTYPPITFDIMKLADRFSLGMLFFVLISRGKTIASVVLKKRITVDQLYEFNEQLNVHMLNPVLYEYFKRENKIAKYAVDNGLKYEYFTTLMGLTNRPVIVDNIQPMPTIQEEVKEEVKGGKRGFTKKNRKYKIKN